MEVAYVLLFCSNGKKLEWYVSHAIGKKLRMFLLFSPKHLSFYHYCFFFSVYFLNSVPFRLAAVVLMKKKLHVQVGVKNKTADVQSKLANVVLVDANKNQVCVSLITTAFVIIVIQRLHSNYDFLYFLAFFLEMIMNMNSMIEQIFKKYL